jgi:hypothetical protein
MTFVLSRVDASEQSFLRCPGDGLYLEGPANLSGECTVTKVTPSPMPPELGFASFL